MASQNLRHHRGIPQKYLANAEEENRNVQQKRGKPDSRSHLQADWD